MKRLVFVYIVHGNSFLFWFDDFSCFYTGPPLCNRSSIDKCAPSFTVASRCFSNACACPNNTLSKDYSLFSLESRFVFLFCPYMHDSIYPSSVMSAFSLHVSGCSQPVLMAHQVVMAFQLLQHSFLHVLRGVLFFFLFSSPLHFQHCTLTEL